MENTASERGKSERGRRAATPQQLGRLGWRDALLRTRAQIRSDEVGLIAAGVAFYAMLAVFPGLAALVSIYGLVADPADVRRIIDIEAVPGPVRELLGEQLRELARREAAPLGIGLLTGVLGALWSANRGASALIRAMNVAYEEVEKRGYFRLAALSFVFTLGAIAVSLIALSLIVAIPAALDASSNGMAARFLAGLPWLTLLAVWMGSLALLYRHGPSRSSPRWRWVWPGSLAATLAWVVASLSFSFYVAHWNRYDEVYGSVGAVVVLLMWFYLSAWVAIVGAQLNAEIEHQTMRDTTVGGPAPLGARGAYVADDVGEVP